jgi:hypothetical protein
VTDTAKTDPAADTAAEPDDYEADWVEDDTPESNSSMEADPNPRKVPVRPPEEITDVCLVVCDDGRRFTVRLGASHTTVVWSTAQPGYNPAGRDLLIISLISSLAVLTCSA